MPDPVTHTSLALATSSAVLAFIFDVPAPVVFAAFSGACFAVAMLELMTFRLAVLSIFGGTVATAFVTPLALHYFGSYEQRGVAALLAFILVYFREDILALIKRGLAKVFGGQA